MITINMTHVSLAIETLHVPAESLAGLDIELSLEDCEITIGELTTSESINSTTLESSNYDDPCYHEDAETHEDDTRSVAQATADGGGERLIYPH